MGKVLFFLLLAVAVVMAGCIGGGRDDTVIQYSNDIVTIENYAVSASNPYPGGYSSISFWVKNNGDKQVTTMADFFNVPKLSLVNLVCPTDAGLENKDCTATGIQCRCENIVLDPFESQPVKLEIKVPGEEVEATKLTPIPYTIAFSINYLWNGYRTANIPIIDGTTRTEPASKFSQSDPSYGPIVVDFQPAVGRTYKVDDKEITERWGTVGRPFEVKMTFNHVGNPPGEVEKPLYINEELGDIITLSTTNMGVATDAYCAFKAAGVGYQLPAPPDSDTRKLLIPAELVCSFKEGNTLVDRKSVV